jgi:hypothetical protein
MTWSELLETPEPKDHLLQLCGEESLLVRNVGRYLKEGALRGERMIVVATAGHARLFTEELEASGVQVGPLLRDGRLGILDAEETLASILPHGELDWPHFDGIAGGLVRQMTADGTRLRAYGEMVDLLWKRGRLGAATRLEEFWNRLQESLRFSLYCSYTVDLLAPGTKGTELLEMASTHSHLLPSQTNGELEAAVLRAMNEVLGDQTVATLLPLIRANVVSHVFLPEPERIVMWLRKNLPPYASDVLSRARGYYGEACIRREHP